MSKATKTRIITWLMAIVVAAVFMLISSWTYVNPNPTTILVKAPDRMIYAFEKVFDDLKLDKDYVIEATDDETKANFVVREGMNQEGKLIAYSPFVAVFNSESDYEKSLIEKEIFVTSEVDSNYNDFDFSKVIQEALSEKGTQFKIYYPSKDSDSWEEFYNLMLFTVNDGYYPSTAEELEKAKQTTEQFLNSRYAEPYNNNAIERSNGIPKNSIYIMAYADLARVYKQSGGFSCRIMYPKTTVYHSYYATYDELGKLVYDSIYTKYDSFSISTKAIGCYYFRTQGYHAKYDTGVYSVGSNVYGLRNYFNAIEIPGTNISDYIEEDDYNE